MVKNLIVFPDGTEISSGHDQKNAIKILVFTECVNNGQDIALGSACASILEVSVLTVNEIHISAGDEISFYHLYDNGERTKIGIFAVEEPERTSKYNLKLTGYDRITKLDKDLTAWLSGLTGWPYSLNTFAGMVCDACGVSFLETDVPNKDFPVRQFAKKTVTGRQIMQWLGEICCRFCRADADGNIMFSWYKDSGKTVRPTGDLYYTKLSYSDYTTAPIESVQIRLAYDDAGALWPDAHDGSNSYVISNNAVIGALITDDLAPYLQTMHNAIKDIQYTPCRIVIPSDPEIMAGSIVTVVTPKGEEISTYVMTSTTKGRTATLESTGGYRLNTSTAANNVPLLEAAQDATENMTQREVFLKLTNGGKLKGIYMENGELYINADFLMAGSISADMIRGGAIQSVGQAYLPPTEEDAIATLYASFGDAFPGYEEYAYAAIDLNGDGYVTQQDALLAMQVAQGLVSMSSCPGATTSEVTVSIEVWNPEKVIRIYGKNMWGTYVETFISAEINRSSFASRSRLDSLINYDIEDTATLFCNTPYVGKRYYNPPMEFEKVYTTIEQKDGTNLKVVRINCGPVSTGGGYFEYDSSWNVERWAATCNGYALPCQMFNAETNGYSLTLGIGHGRIYYNAGSAFDGHDLIVTLWFTQSD